MFIIYFVRSIITVFACNTITVRTEICPIRYEYREVLSGFSNALCITSKTCQLPLHIGYIDYPPYIYSMENRTKPAGLLVGMIGVHFTILLFQSLNFAVVQLEICPLRYEYRSVKGFSKGLCSSRTCQLPLHIKYLDHPPYVYTVANQSKPDGLLVGILEASLDSCCNECVSQIKYTRMEDVREIFDNNFTLYMPTSMPDEDLIYNPTSLPEYPFVGFINKLSIVYASIAIETQVERQFNYIVKRISNLWPVFAIASITTLIAGICIWLLDTWFNKTEFPRSFFDGTCEGCWWAFISMTTVGYGDRTPRSFHARLFAVLWITFGITCASILTASLSSIITTVAINENTKMGGKTICIYLNTSVEAGIVYQNGGEVLAFDSIERIEQALHDKKCTGVAMESHMLLYHWNTLKRHNQLEILDILAAPDRSIGIVFFGYNRSQQYSWAKYLTSFYHLNRDHKDTLLAQGRKELDRKLNFNLLNQDESKTGIFDRPTDDFVSVIVYMTYVLVGFIVFGITIDLILRRRRYLKTEQKKKMADGDLSDEVKSSQFNGAFSR